MKAVLGIGVLFAAVLGLTAWIDRIAPSEIAASASNSDARSYSILARSSTATQRMQSGEAEIEVLVRAAGQQVVIQEKTLVESPSRMYSRGTILGQLVEVFTAPSKTCVRTGQVWSPYTQPLPRPTADITVPKDLKRHEDSVINGEKVYHFSGLIPAVEVEKLLASRSLRGTSTDVEAQYFIGKDDLIIRRITLDYGFIINGQRADTTFQMTYSRVNEPVKVPDTIPLTCDPARTF